jgi:hypothetical protein
MTGQLGQNSCKRTAVRGQSGLPVEISLKVNLDDNTKGKGKVITQPDNNIFVPIQPDDSTKCLRQTVLLPSMVLVHTHGLFIT